MALARPGVAVRGAPSHLHHASAGARLARVAPRPDHARQPHPFSTSLSARQPPPYAIAAPSELAARSERARCAGRARGAVGPGRGGAGGGGRGAGRWCDRGQRPAEGEGRPGAGGSEGGEAEGGGGPTPAAPGLAPGRPGWRASPRDARPEHTPPHPRARWQYSPTQCPMPETHPPTAGPGPVAVVYDVGPSCPKHTSTPAGPVAEVSDVVPHARNTHPHTDRPGGTSLQCSAPCPEHTPTPGGPVAVVCTVVPMPPWT